MFAFSNTESGVTGRRRRLFFLQYLFWLGLAVVPMFRILSQQGGDLLDVAEFVVFVLLLSQVVFGFTLALTGYWVLRSGGDPTGINQTLAPETMPEELPATAIVMPIFNEDVGRVFKGLRVMYESLQKTGRAEVFDFFILSDSSDPNVWTAEEMAWLELCKQVQGFGRIFYRNRRVALHQKSGNIADFCRRWGANYRYMIVLDADSIMTGGSFVRLASLMEKNPSCGIIQTTPKAVLGRTLFQRIMQFAGRVYGPIFMAGANYWQLGSGSYWGHNAIIRLRPFMQHCAMPELPKTEALGTRILSHDTIEAALMRRAGASVWLAYELDGSYEESPPDLLESLQRDRRWCRGNMQHVWFLLARGLKLPSRIHIWNGIMGFVSSPLWLLLLLLGTLGAVTGAAANSSALSGLFSNTFKGWLLLAYVMSLLLLPKVLGVLLLFRAPEKLKTFGSCRKVLESAAGEIIFSLLLAPILMFFHTRFVLAALTGTKIQWGAQKRNANEVPSWRDCFSVHWANTLFVLGWGGVIGWLSPSFLPWMGFVFLGPLLAVPFSRWTALKTVAQHAREKGWFLIPEERTPPVELRDLAGIFPGQVNQFFRGKRYAADYGLLQAVLDPYVNAVHVSFLRQREAVAVRTREYLSTLEGRLLQDGPATLTPEEKYTLLWDADSMLALHRKLWRSPASSLHEWWAAAFRHYNESLALSVRRTVNAAH